MAPATVTKDRSVYAMSHAAAPVARAAAGDTIRL